jgi:transposase
MRIIGLDIHRAFAEAVAWDDGKLKRLGRVDMRRPHLEAFAKKLSKEDVVSCGGAFSQLLLHFEEALPAL